MCELRKGVLEAMNEWNEALNNYRDSTKDMMDWNIYNIKAKEEKYNSLIKEYKKHLENGCKCDCEFDKHTKTSLIVMIKKIFHKITA